MKFLNHDINRTLLGLIIFFLVFFIISSVYYEISLKKIINNKNNSNNKLDDITVQAILDKLNDSDRLKETALIDKALLGEKYKDLFIQSEALNKEKAQLKEEITLLKSELEYQKVKLDGPLAQFRLIQDKNQQIRQLKEKIDALCLLLKSKEISTNECD